MEESTDAYIDKLVRVFSEVRRVLRDDGTLWLNIGDSYAGSGKGRNANGAYSSISGGKQRTNVGTITGKLSKTPIINGCKPKDLLGIPWILALSLRSAGWYLRQSIIWSKPNPMPESVTDRPTRSHEYIFLLSKNQRYYYDNEAIKEPSVKICNQQPKGSYGSGKQCRNKRDVWTIVSKPFPGAHFATFPPELIQPCVLAGSRLGGIVLDPFFGAGTTGLVAMEEQRGYIGIELNPEYVDLSRKRLAEAALAVNIESKLQCEGAKDNEKTN